MGCIELCGGLHTTQRYWCHSVLQPFIDRCPGIGLGLSLCEHAIKSLVGFSEAETRYKLSDGRTVKNAADAALPRKHKRRKTKEQPVSSVTVVAAAVQETKETLSNEKKPQRITASKKPSKYEKPSKCCNLYASTVVHRKINIWKIVDCTVRSTSYWESCLKASAKERNANVILIVLMVSRSLSWLDPKPVPDVSRRWVKPWWNETHQFVSFQILSPLVHGELARRPYSGNSVQTKLWCQRKNPNLKVSYSAVSVQLLGIMTND